MKADDRIWQRDQRVKYDLESLDKIHQTEEVKKALEHAWTAGNELGYAEGYDDCNKETR